MNILRLPSTLIALLLLLRTSTSAAEPLVGLDEGLVDLQNVTLAKRCENPCGWAGQLCCQSGQTCYTDSNDQAQCGNSGVMTAAPATQSPGYWQYWTSTYVETDLVTRTSVYSSYVGAISAGPVTSVWAQASQTAAAPTCPASETACGNICCPSGHYCAVWGQCSPATTIAVSPSAPLRPTSSGAVIVTRTTFATTTTVPFLAPMATGQNVNITSTQESSSGLSGGAIAGIVIGVLAAIIILLFICIFFCFKAAWDGLLAIFGLGGRRRRTEVIEESYHRSGDRRDSRRWPGNQPSRIARNEKRSGGFGGFAPVAAGLTGLAVALGLRRKADRRRRNEKSDYTASTYDETEYSSESKFAHGFSFPLNRFSN